MNKNTKAGHPALAPINDAALARKSWKLFQIMAEFVEGFERLAAIRPSVSIFGSARVGPEHRYSKLAEELDRRRRETKSRALLALTSDKNSESRSQVVLDSCSAFYSEEVWGNRDLPQVESKSDEPTRLAVHGGSVRNKRNPNMTRRIR